MSSTDIIKIEIIELPYQHHGGAWKVAYADFVTAMMAFFLLMWLLNVTDVEKKNAISDYFSPSHPKVSSTKSGAGGVLGGLTMSPQGAMASQKSQVIKQEPTRQRLRGTEVKSTVAKAREQAEKKRFEKAAEKIKKAIEENKDIAELSENVMIDMTPEGLRIQIVDQDGEPMFPPGSAKMFDKTKTLLKEITNVVLEMPNELSIRGHTDAVRYAAGATYTNWELSADRANATRHVMLEANLPETRLNNVMGKAHTEPLITDDPLDPRNRRITMILLKEDITNPLPPDDGTLIDESDPYSIPTPAEDPYKKTPGAVEFP